MRNPHGYAPLRPRHAFYTCIFSVFRHFGCFRLDFLEAWHNRDPIRLIRFFHFDSWVDTTCTISVCCFTGVFQTSAVTFRPFSCNCVQSTSCTIQRIFCNSITLSLNPYVHLATLTLSPCTIHGLYVPSRQGYLCALLGRMIQL